MKNFLILGTALTLLVGCKSSHVGNATTTYPVLNRSLDDFCRHPIHGIFTLSDKLRYHWDIVISDESGVRLGWIHKGEIGSVFEYFEEALPTEKMLTDIPLGKEESEIVSLLGQPSRTWHDLVPIIDHFIPITMIFGRDTKYCDYDMFTTTPTSDVVLMRLSLSYSKDDDDNWLLTELHWEQEGTRRLKANQGMDPTESGS